MSSKQRREEKRRQADIDYDLHMREEARKASRSMWERIEEADASGDVKEILHMLASYVGLEV